MRSHKVDIGGLLAGTGQRLRVDDEIALEPFEGMTFPGRMRVHLEMRCLDGMLEIEGSIDGEFQGSCDLCLEDLERAIHLDVEERLDPRVDSRDDPFSESNVLSGTRLDVADLVQQLALSTLPMGLRCKADCAGLCSVCGTNLNAGTCSCDGEQRLAR